METTLPLLTASIESLNLYGLGGGSVFNVAGPLPYTGGLLLDGGDPGTANQSGATGPGHGQPGR